MQQKKQRERERKDLDTLGRRHLANVRVVQRNVVYIVNMNPRFAKEEVSSTSVSRRYFVVDQVTIANSDFTLQRLLWPVREDIQDCDRQTHIHESQESGHWTLRHLP